MDSSSNIRLLRFFLLLLLSGLTDVVLADILEEELDNTDELNLNPDDEEDVDRVEGLKEKLLGCMMDEGMPVRMSGCRGLEEEVITANFLFNTTEKIQTTIIIMVIISTATVLC